MALCVSAIDYSYEELSIYEGVEFVGYDYSQGNDLTDTMGSGFIELLSSSYSNDVDYVNIFHMSINVQKLYEFCDICEEEGTLGNGSNVFEIACDKFNLLMLIRNYSDSSDTQNYVNYHITLLNVNSIASDYVLNKSMSNSIDTLSTENNELSATIEELSATNEELFNENIDLQLEVDGLNDLLQADGNEAYMNGYNDGIESTNIFKEGLFYIFSAPNTILANSFGFEIFGFNFYQVIKLILTILIVAFCFKIIFKYVV